MAFIKAFLQWLFRRLYRVSIKGLNNYKEAGDRVLIVANHASYLDGVLLAVFLPDRITFTVDSRIAKAWWVRPALALVDFFSIDTTNPLSTRTLIRFLSENRKLMIFPEGRLTVTGGLMKIYQGPGLLADKSQARVLPSASMARNIRLLPTWIVVLDTAGFRVLRYRYCRRAGFRCPSSCGGAPGAIGPPQC